MPKFLTAQRIIASVEALADTRGKPGLLEFLLVKRTLTIKGSTSVAITQSEPTYERAVAELAAIHHQKKIDVKAPKEFYNVFASKLATEGFLRGKYISNGTGTTIGGNAWQAILDLSSDKPRKASLKLNYVSKLADLLLKSGPVSKPSLGEIAVWRFRHTDIAAVLGNEPDPVKRFKSLELVLIAECGLTAGEIAALFDSAGGVISDADLQATRAEPADYLNGLVLAQSGHLCSIDLVAALAAKPFVIITGTSGTGKSRSALRLAEKLQTLYASQTDGQLFQLVPIGPDWTSPKKLLGYRTPFGHLRQRPDGTPTNESYEITETLRIILRACHPDSTKIPHFLVFDEMNLSHVERYFAPFLSLMEASSIFEESENAAIVDRQSLTVIGELLNAEDNESSEAQSVSLLIKNDKPLELPPNLFYIGTVNIDETTYMFSPKVLDRAHVLEVRAQLPSTYINGGSFEETIDLSHANELLREAIDDRQSSDSSESNPTAVVDSLSSKHGIDADELKDAKRLSLRVLDGCFTLLGPTGFEFGFRVVKEVHGYMYVWIRAQLSMGATPQDAMARWVDGLDRALFQKVLPKIHGNRSALGDSLKALAAFLDGRHAKSDPAAKYTIGAGTVVEITQGQEITLPKGASFVRSRSKLLEMQARLVSRNYVSFVK